MEETNRRSGAWFVLAAAVLWGTTGTAQAFAPSGASPLAVGTLRLAIGGLGLLAFAAARGVLRGQKPWPFWPTGLAAVFIAAYQLFFFAGVARTGVAVGTIVGIGSAPIAGGILGYFGRGERPGSRWVMATLLAIAGCILLILPGGSVRVDPLGVLLAMSAGASYAAFTLASKGLLEERQPDSVMAVVFSIGTLFLIPLLFISDLRWLLEPRGVAVSLHLGLVTAAAAYILFARGLSAVPVATAVTLTLAEPLTAGTLGIFLLGEQLTPAALLGIGLIFGGLALLSFSRKPAVVDVEAIS